MGTDKLYYILQQHGYTVYTDSAYKDDKVLEMSIRITVRVPLDGLYGLYYSSNLNSMNMYFNAWSSHGHHLSAGFPSIPPLGEVYEYYEKIITDFEKQFKEKIEENLEFYKLEIDNPFYNEAIHKEQQDCFHRMMDKTQMTIDDKTVDVIMPVNDDCDDACCLYYTTKDYMTCEDISHIRKSEFSKLYINSKVYDMKNENLYLYLGDYVFKKLNSKEIPNIKRVENKKINKDRKPSNKIRTYKKI